MRGDDRQPRAMFSDVSAEERVPEAHPLRAIRSYVDEILPLLQILRLPRRHDLKPRTRSAERRSFQEHPRVSFFLHLTTKVR